MKIHHVIITGASQGIGAALAREFFEQGWYVHLLARNQLALHEVQDSLGQDASERSALYAIDVQDTDALVTLLETIDDAAQGVDLVIANAGVGAPLHLQQYSWGALEHAAKTNYVGATATLTALLPRMVQRKQGHLLGISSFASYGALPGAAAYCSPKAGLSMLLDCLRLDVEPLGVCVTEAKLGFVDTAALAGVSHSLPQLKKAKEVARVLFHRLAARPGLIVYPQPLGLLARVGGILPFWLRRLIFRVTGEGR